MTCSLSMQNLCGGRGKGQVEVWVHKYSSKSASLRIVRQAPATKQRTGMIPLGTYSLKTGHRWDCSERNALLRRPEIW